MAGLMNKLRELVGIEEEEYEYEEFEQITPERRPYDREREHGLGEEVRQSNRDRIWEQRQRERDRERDRERERDFEREYERDRERDRDRYAQAYEPLRNQQREKVINMPGSDRIQELTSRFDIVVIEPKSFDECPKLVDSLKARKPVIVNLEKIETETARKIFDFLSGATYAVNGDLQKIANNIFVFLPANVEVSTSSGYPREEENPWR